MLQYLKTQADCEAFIDKYDNFLFDCDGKLNVMTREKRNFINNTMCAC